MCRLRIFLNKGIFVSLSPDGMPSPIKDIFSTTTMQAYLKRNIIREEAAIAYTKSNPYAELAKKEYGTLMSGMLADHVVLSEDIFTIPVTTSVYIKLAYNDKWAYRVPAYR